MNILLVNPKNLSVFPAWKAIKGFIKVFIRNTPILRILYGKTG